MRKMTLDFPLKRTGKSAGRHTDVCGDIEVTVFIRLNIKTVM
jgi:hypothetical protein